MILYRGDVLLIVLAVVLFFMLPGKLFFAALGVIIGLVGLFVASSYPTPGIVMVLVGPVLIVYGIMLHIREARREAAEADETARAMQIRMRGRDGGRSR